MILPSRWQEAADLGWHGPAGAVVSWQHFGETDRSVLDAIKYHSVPQPDASVLTKLIFVADKLDAGPTQFESTLDRLPARCADPDQALLCAIENAPPASTLSGGDRCYGRTLRCMRCS